MVESNENKPESPKIDSKIGGFIIIVLLLLVIMMSWMGSSESDGQGSGGSTQIAESETGLPVLLELGADSCPACRDMVPILAELEQSHADKFTIEQINVGTDRTATQRYGIRYIPVQIFYDAAGTELFRHVGGWSKQEILDKWEELGYPMD